MLSVDLNCDMGEGCPNDAELMKYISSANIACGLHAGDAAIMKRTVELAIENGIAIGAHPSYPDRENFGRAAMQMSLTAIYQIVLEQIATLSEIVTQSGGKLHHVKPHGALYNQSAKDADLAQAVAAAIRDFDPELILFGLSGSFSITAAKNLGLLTAAEAFADRTYQSDGSLTPRSMADALINESSIASTQARQMIQHNKVTTLDGQTIEVRADTICIHGDGDKAVDFARAIHRALVENNIEIRPING